MNVYLCLASALAFAMPAALSAQTVVFQSDFDVDSEDVADSGFNSAFGDDSPSINWQSSGGQFIGQRFDSGTPQSTVVSDVFSTTGPVVIASFDMNFSGTGSTLTDYKFGASFYFGGGFNVPASQQPPTTNGTVENGNVFGYFNINTVGASEGGANSGWGVVPGQDFDGVPVEPGALYTSTQSVLWVMNDGDSAYSYTDPNGATSTVAAGTWDLWLGNNQQVDDKGATLSWATEEGAGNDQTINGFMLRWHRQEATSNIWTFDNMTVAVVPEPSTYALLGGLVALGAVLARRRFRK